MNAIESASRRDHREQATRNLASISPFFIVQDLQASISYYIERLGFQLDFHGPEGDAYYAMSDSHSLGRAAPSR